MAVFTSKPYRQLLDNESDEVFKTLIKEPLLWAVYTVCALRARRIKKLSPEGLGQFEFWLSETEYAKFGLKKTQSGQLRRKIMKLICMKVASKPEKRIGNDGANVYRLVARKPIFINPEVENELEDEQRTNSERIETNKKDNKDKKDKMLSLASFKEKLTKPQSTTEETFELAVNDIYQRYLNGYEARSWQRLLELKLRDIEKAELSDRSHKELEKQIYPNLTEQRLSKEVGNG